MKVLVVTNMYPNPSHLYSGIFVKDFVESLQGLGVKLDVFFTNSKRGRAEYFKQIPHLYDVLRRQRYDLLHAQHTYCVYQVKMAQILARNDTPIMFTIHEGEALMPAGASDDQADWIKRLVYLKRPKRWALYLADYVISVEQHIPKVLGYRKPYSVVPPGVNLQRFAPLDKNECQKRLGIAANGGPVLFFPADPRRPLKGFDLLQQSLGYLPLKPQVLTGGGIPPELMPYYMNAADVVVHTSHFEASPMVIKEAMACNVPAVSTDVGDVKSTMGDSPGYFICKRDPVDVAERIRQALEFRDRAKGRQQIVKLSLALEQTADAYLQIYRRILEAQKAVLSGATCLSRHE